MVQSQFTQKSFPFILYICSFRLMLSRWILENPSSYRNHEVKNRETFFTQTLKAA
ncbi:hypothetical protein SK128_014940 [Halocaridina rubra]|uniref:Uncharacterized protein n=1 Tax=Halocaridina rubra TaxID=373956 RepID=A0AAN9A056_HALRR